MPERRKPQQQVQQEQHPHQKQQPKQLYFDFAQQHKNKEDCSDEKSPKKEFSQLEVEINTILKQDNPQYFSPPPLEIRADLENAIKQYIRMDGHKVPDLRVKKKRDIERMYVAIGTRHNKNEWRYKETIKKWHEKYSVLPPGFKNIEYVERAGYSELKTGYVYLKQNTPIFASGSFEAHLRAISL